MCTGNGGISECFTGLWQIFCCAKLLGRSKLRTFTAAPQMYRRRKRQKGIWKAGDVFMVSYIFVMTIMAGVLPPTRRSKCQAEKLPVLRPNFPLYHYPPHPRSSLRKTSERNSIFSILH